MADLAWSERVGNINQAHPAGEPCEGGLEISTRRIPQANHAKGMTEPASRSEG
jgi:hypothetical protein